MSFCKFPLMEEGAYKKLARNFLRNTPDIQEWNLLSLQDMYACGNDLAIISEVVPFRSEECRRSKRCCGVCTRRCYARCLQDSLHRLYMWRKLVETTPKDEQESIPLGIRMIVKKDFDNHRELSWAVGEILSQSSNTTVKEYMQDAKLRPEENPYKVDYAPQVAISPVDGRRMADPVTGALHIMEWPETGLCPYCLPEVTVDRRITKQLK